jgi:hypothetical protein
MIGTFRTLAEHYHIMGGLMIGLQVCQACLILLEYPQWSYEQVGAVIFGILPASLLFIPRSSSVSHYLLPYYVIKIAGPADF